MSLIAKNKVSASLVMAFFPPAWPLQERKDQETAVAGKRLLASRLRRFSLKTSLRSFDYSVWDMLAERLKAFKPYLTDNFFGITILRKSEHCDLALAGHTFLQLLSISGHLRYKPATSSELHVPKKFYKSHLTTIQGNCERLLAVTADERQKDRKTVPAVVQQL